MLLFPLYLTGFSLWDALKDQHWYGAEQVLVLSASSKTGIGLAYALDEDREGIQCVGLTSEVRRGFVEGLGLYERCIAYEALEGKVDVRPTAIVDMSGNSSILGRLHDHLGEAMVQTLSVGLTHWDQRSKDERIIRDRTTFFFAPAQIQKRMKEWGRDVFHQRSTQFVEKASKRSVEWLQLRRLDGLDALEACFADVLSGTVEPEKGLVVDL